MTWVFLIDGDTLISTPRTLLFLSLPTSILTLLESSTPQGERFLALLPMSSLTKYRRLFARGYLGPNSTYGDIYVLKSNVPESIANSLAPSDSCPTYNDNGGGDNLTTWNNLYLPAVTKRINSHIKGNFNFTDSDVTNFRYLCGFETQITGRRSPWCNIFTDDELSKYEYAQDLRYYYGSGESSQLNISMVRSR